MNTSFKNIVFDFGGVLLDIDYKLTYQAFESILGVTFEPHNLPEECQKAMFDFEMGKINVETFLWNIQRLSVKEMPHGIDIIRAWNAMLIGWNPLKFQFLSNLKSKNNIYLLSNTNELHLHWVYQDLKKKHNIHDFDTRFFTKTYYSHLVGKRKPNADIFEFVEEDAQLIPSETIFIDDLKENVATAERLGWMTYHHDPKDDLIHVFERNGW